MLDLAASPMTLADRWSYPPQAEEQYPSLGGQPGSGMTAVPVAQHLASTADTSMRSRHADSSQPGRPHAESQEHALARQFFPDEFEDAEDPGGVAVQARQQQQETAAQRSTAPTTRRHACSGVHAETVRGLAVSTLTHWRARDTRHIGLLLDADMVFFLPIVRSQPRPLVRVTVKCPCGQRSSHQVVEEGAPAPPIACNTACQRKQRKARLADAFGVDDANAYIAVHDRNRCPRCPADAQQHTSAWRSHASGAGSCSGGWRCIRVAIV